MGYIICAQMLDFRQILQGDFFVVVFVDVGNDPAHPLDHHQVVVWRTDHQTVLEGEQVEVMVEKVDEIRGNFDAALFVVDAPDHVEG